METLDIINAISQVVSNTHDGALDESGELLKIGLRREEGDPLFDKRIVDGFGAHVKGTRLCISYHSEIPLKEVHNKKFESEIESLVEGIKSFIQKEFKKITKSSLSLKDPSEIDVLVQYISRIRTSVTAYKTYEISDIKSEGYPQESKDKLDSSIRSWLELGPNGGSKRAKRPKNDTRKS
jgi:hypothetical protein